MAYQKGMSLERLIEKYLKRYEFKTERNVILNGHEIDVLAHKRVGPFSFDLIVEAKCYSNPVGKEDVMKFSQVIADTGYKGIMVTASEFTKDAREYAKSKRIELWNGKMVERMKEELNENFLIENYVLPYLPPSRVRKTLKGFLRKVRSVELVYEPHYVFEIRYRGKSLTLKCAKLGLSAWAKPPRIERFKNYVLTTEAPRERKLKKRISEEEARSILIDAMKDKRKLRALLGEKSIQEFEVEHVNFLYYPIYLVEFSSKKYIVDGVTGEKEVLNT